MPSCPEPSSESPGGGGSQRSIPGFSLAPTSADTADSATTPPGIPFIKLG